MKVVKVFHGSRANAELVPKFDVALHASLAALPKATLQISPCPTPRRRVIVKQRN
jgi:hypothetical protein